MMPRGDGTGPMGAGQMTGRAMGFCAGYAVPGFQNPGFDRGFGRGFGMGFGRGRGFGRGMGWRRAVNPAPGYYNPVAPVVNVDDQKKYLTEELEYMEKEVETIKARLADMDSTNKK